MKIIDLLNKIANDEKVPKKIKWGQHLFERVSYGYTELNSVSGHKFSDYIDMDHTDLNDEVEIIEEDKEYEDIDTEFESGDTTEIIIQLLHKTKQLIKNQQKIINQLENK